MDRRRRNDYYCNNTFITIENGVKHYMIPVTIAKSDDGRTYTVEGFPQLEDNEQSVSLTYQGSGTWKFNSFNLKTVSTENSLDEKNALMTINWGDSKSDSLNDSHTYKNSGSFMVSVFLKLGHNLKEWVWARNKSDDLPTETPMTNRFIVESKIKRKWAQEEYNEWFYDKLEDAGNMELALDVATAKAPWFGILIDEVILEDLEPENSE